MLEELPPEIFSNILSFLPLSILPVLLTLSRKINARTLIGISRKYVQDRVARVPLLLLSTLDWYPHIVGVTTSRELVSLSSRFRGSLHILFQNSVSDVLPLIYSVVFTRIVLYPEEKIKMMVLNSGYVLRYEKPLLRLYLGMPSLGRPRPSLYYPRGTTWEEHDADTLCLIQRLKSVCTIKIHQIGQIPTLLLENLQKLQFPIVQEKTGDSQT